METKKATTRITNEPLIKLKLFVPHLRTGLVSRPQLIKKLEKSAQSALTLISAPAGYGKTTLLSEWLDSRRKVRTPVSWTVCWVSLDAGDNDPIRFLTYLTAALENVHPELGAKARTLIQTAQSLQPTTPLSLLINDLQEIPQTIFLVLDDYQFINNPAIHDGMIFLLEHLPGNVHLVISTRSDPPLPIARLRGRNQLNELRAKDLRFTSVEAADFLNKVFDLSLTPKQIALLENRTEGWIAGLQMAAISMQGRADIDQFLNVFSGSHRFIMDYLAEEVLNRQTSEVQAFLLQTSILERLSEPLCSAVLTEKPAKGLTTFSSETDSSFVRPNKKSIIEELELSNLFFVALDDNRTWYRYHHLFSDLLRVRLEQSSPEIIPTLHIRASTWFENNGWFEEAIHHSLLAKEWDNAGRLIERNMQSYLENGQLATIMKWIEGLPLDIIYRNPRLCVKVAEAYAHAGAIDQVEPFLSQAEGFVSDFENSLPDQGTTQDVDLSRADVNMIRAMIAMMRGLRAVFSGDPERALSLIQTALANISEIEPRELAWLFWVEGWAYRHLGVLDRTLDLFKTATRYAQESGILLRDIWSDLATATRLVGKLPQAVEILTNSLQTAVDRGVQNQGNLSRDESLLSLILLEQNQLDRAYTHANRAVAYTHWWPSHNHISIAHASLALILMARGELNDGIRAIQKADQERRNRLVTPFIHSIVSVALVRSWLMQGDWIMLDQWSSDLSSKFRTIEKDGKQVDEYLEMQLIMLVRIWMEKTNVDRQTERNDESLHLLACLESGSRTAGRIDSLVEILFLQNTIRFALGKIEEALSGLDECLTLAEPGGYMRIFLNTGESARVLLTAYFQEPSSKHRDYVLTILKALGGLSSPEKLLTEYPASITTREMEVLHLLAKGYNNRQMAEKLVVAEGTIKFHVHHILEKLDVKSRTQAIARARDLHLL